MTQSNTPALDCDVVQRLKTVTMATSLKGVAVTEERAREIRVVADEWALSNGATMRTIDKGDDSDDSTKVARCAYTLFPSIMPRKVLQKAKYTMKYFNSLMHRVAMDHEFLEKSLKNVIEVDAFTARLWDIYTHVRNKGLDQPPMLGLFRSDYMMNVKDGRQRDDESLSADDLELKQIEFNTIASGLTGLTEAVGRLHKLTLSMADKSSYQIPDNTPSLGLSKGLIKAWELYGNSKAVIVFIVSPQETNIMDQYAIEFAVYRQNPMIRVIRRTLLDIGTRGELDEKRTLTVDDNEVAVIYFRDGYTSENYTSDKQWDARLLMEMSKAIKSPSIQHQLVGTKKIQQVLAEPGCLERFIEDPQVIKNIRDTFAGQYSVDLGPEGDRAVEMALANPDKFVLKPQREGGGHNLYGEDIREFLEENVNSKERNAYILMERIFPWEQKNYLVKDEVPFKLSRVVGEVGVYGVYIESRDSKEVVNYECGHMIRTKRVDTDEGGIAAGFAFVDSVLFTDD